MEVISSKSSNGSLQGIVEVLNAELPYIASAAFAGCPPATRSVYLPEDKPNDPYTTIRIWKRYTTRKESGDAFEDTVPDHF